MLLAVARLDAPNALAAIKNRHHFFAGGIDLGQGSAFCIRLLHQSAVLVGEIGAVAIQLQFTFHTEAGHFFG